MKIGQGWDIHRLEKGRKLFLGGIEIACELGLSGHSDADVLLHAIADALLGAAGLGDIGEHFPDTDPEYRDADSKELLRQAYAMVKGKGSVIGNIDCTIFCEVVKITPFKSKMKNIISEILGIAPESVNIKAKTNESLDAVGQKKAIAAAAVVLLEKNKSSMQYSMRKK